MPQFDSSAFWGIAGILAGVVVAIFFFYIGMNKKILEYQITSTPLISEKMSRIPGINITIHEQPVKSLVSTAIKFTNVGNQTLVSSDFASQDPLGIPLIGHLYSYDVTADNKNLMSLLKFIDGKGIDIEFEFLKPKQSFTVTILHDGKVGVFGELKTGEIRRNKPRSFFTRKMVGFCIASLSILTTMVYFCSPNDSIASIVFSCVLFVGTIGMVIATFSDYG